MTRDATLPLGFWIACAVFAALLAYVGYQISIQGDLFPLWAAGRFIAAGEFGHVYTGIEPKLVVTDPAWLALLHHAILDAVPPYVQPPWIATVFAPLAAALDFRTFAIPFQIANVAAQVGVAVLAIRYWYPRNRNPWAIFGLVVLISLSQPGVLLIYYNQTQALIILAIVAGLIAAERGRWIGAGLLVGLAACVKLTPAIVLAYWLLTGRARAALAGGGLMLACALASWLMIDPTLNAAFLDNTRTMSDVVIMGPSNHALARILTWWRTGLSTRGEILPLDADFRIGLHVALVALFAASVGFARSTRDPERRRLADLLLIVGYVPLLPLAWNHYFYVVALGAVALLQARTPIRWPTFVTVQLLVSANIYLVRANREITVAVLSELAAGALLAGLLALLIARRRAPAQDVDAGAPALAAGA